MRANVVQSGRGVWSSIGNCVAARRIGLLIVICGATVANSAAGSYAPGAGKPGSDAIAASNAGFVEWASSVTNLTRGPQSAANPAGGLASFGSSTAAVGKADNSVVSLGDGGSITVTFDQAITDGPGADFAVFENGFASGGLYFLELGFVEVSSDGTNFFRFPSVSLTDTATQIGGFGLLDPTNLYNLAGKYASNFGTPFDLSEMAAASPLLDVGNVRYVRVVDVIGSVNPLYATYDSAGHAVNDPWPTASTSGGFDFDAVGVLHAVPEPQTIVSAAIAGLLGMIAVGRRLRRRGD